MGDRRAGIVVAGVALLAASACGGDATTSPTRPSVAAATTPSSSAPPASSPSSPSAAPAVVTTTTQPVASTMVTTATTITTTTTTTLAPPATVPATTMPSTTAAPVPSHPRQAPFAADVAISYARDEHHDYPAADIFAASDCGTPVAAASDGVIDGLERATTYDRATDDPALRGGNWVSIRGPDGVRYYVAHLEQVEPALSVGASVAAGDVLGTMGSTGRASACHVHFGLSPGACPVEAWWVRRGVVWPAQYLDAWQTGDDRSPADEVAAWLAAHPAACTDPAATGFPTG